MLANFKILSMTSLEKCGWVGRGWVILRSSKAYYNSGLIYGIRNFECANILLSAGGRILTFGKDCNIKWERIFVGVRSVSNRFDKFRWNRQTLTWNCGSWFIFWDNAGGEKPLKKSNIFLIDICNIIVNIFIYVF